MIEVKALVGELAPLIRDMVREEIQRLVQKQAAHGYAVHQALLSKIETAHMGEIMDSLLAKNGGQGVIKTDHKVNTEVRDSRICFVNPYALDEDVGEKENALIQSVFMRMVGLAHVTQATTLSGEVPPVAPFPKELMQFSEYVEGQFYNEHQDSDGANTEQRALSMSLLIEAPEEGGEFKFRDVEIRPEHAAIVEQAGSAVVFASSAFHSVTPVAKGRRRSIVFWFNQAAPSVKQEAA